MIPISSIYSSTRLVTPTLGWGPRGKRFQLYLSSTLRQLLRRMSSVIGTYSRGISMLSRELIHLYRTGSNDLTQNLRLQHIHRRFPAAGNSSADARAENFCATYKGTTRHVTRHIRAEVHETVGDLVWNSKSAHGHFSKQHIIDFLGCVDVAWCRDETGTHSDALGVCLTIVRVIYVIVLAITRTYSHVVRSALYPDV